MTADQVDLLEDLVGWGFLPPDAFEMPLELTSLTRRHRNIRCTIEAGLPHGFWPDLLIKRADPSVGGSRESLFREHQFFQLAAEEPFAYLLENRLHPPLRFPTPSPDPGPGRREVMVFSWLPDASELWTGPGGASGRDLGELLAALHVAARLVPARIQALACFHPEPPSTLWLDVPSPSVLQRAAPAHLKLLRIFQGESALRDALERRRMAWRETVKSEGTLIHGDMSVGNTLRIGRRALLVDWETASWGDPAWDLASGLAASAQSRVMAHLRGLELDTRQAAGAFWRRYWQRRRELEGESLGLAESFRRRIVDFLTLRWLQAAWQRAEGRRSMDPLMLALVQLGANLQAEPECILDAFFGSSLGEIP